MSASQMSLFEDSLAVDDQTYRESQLITYIGSKRSLLSFIEKGIQLAISELGKERVSFLDLFTGSGVVARMAKRYANHLVVNDIELYSRIISECYLANQSEIDIDVLANDFEFLISAIQNDWAPGFITELYAPADESRITKNDRVFYTRRNATYIDTARRAISALPEDRQAYFLGPLLSEASIHANTSGVFKGFYKNQHGIGQYGGTGKNALTRILKDIELRMPVFSPFETSYEVFHRDANELVRDIEHVDIAYFDPPYNQHPYGSNYFMLNLICEYKRPESVSKVSGIPDNWNRSLYNKARSAERALFDAIDQCKASFVLLSYNSEGFVSQDRFLRELESVGKVSVFDTKYNTFRGSRNLRNREIHVTEFLYLVDKR